MRTADVAAAAFALAAEPGAGRAPPADSQPFGELLSRMDDDAGPAPEVAARQPGPAVEQETGQEGRWAPLAPIAFPQESAGLTPQAILDWLLERRASPAPRPDSSPGGPAQAAVAGITGPETACSETATAKTAIAKTAGPNTAGPDTADAETADADSPPDLPPLSAAGEPRAVGPVAPLPVIAPVPSVVRDAAGADPVPAGPVRGPLVAGPAAPEGGVADPLEPVRLAVLRQETHFAPVRAFSGASPGLAAARRPDAGVGDARPGPGRGGAAASEPAASSGAAREAEPDRPTAAAGQAPPAIAGPVPAALPFAGLAQVGRALAAELGQRDAAGSAARGMASAPDIPAAPGPVRVLDIALMPEALGRVVVHLRLTPQGLSVRLKADNPATAELLAEDRAHLAGILKSAGFAEVDLEVGGSVLALPDAPGRGFSGAQPAAPRQDREQSAGSGGETGRQGRNGQQDRTFRDDDAAPSFADEPGAGGR